MQTIKSNTSPPKKLSLFNNNYFKFFIFAITIFVINLFMVGIFKNNPDLIEKVYSNNIYTFILSIVTFFTGYIPFSITEVAIILIALYIIVNIVITIVRLISKKFIWKKFLAFVSSIVSTVLIIYSLFNIVWGINFYRYDYAQLANYQEYDFSLGEITNLSLSMIDELNKDRANLPVDENGLFSMSFSEIKSGTIDIYNSLEDTLPEFAKGNAGAYRIKPALLSGLLTKTGISGIYICIFAEPMINTQQPTLFLPSTACHEVAHQMGFTKENEANFISYVMCLNSSLPEFRYSGTLLALTYLFDDIHAKDPDLHRELYYSLSEDVRNDLSDYNRFWTQNINKTASDVQTQINDAYLQEYNQESGVISYNEMSKLVLLYHKYEKDLTLFNNIGEIFFR